MEFPGPQPMVLIKGLLESPGITVVVREKNVKCQNILIGKIPCCACFILLTEYSYICTNFCCFFEHLFLEITPPKRSKLQHFIT